MRTITIVKKEKKGEANKNSPGWAEACVQFAKNLVTKKISAHNKSPRERGTKKRKES